MEGGAQKLLESATQRTLHAHNFSRTSSQASNVLTDLVSRYLLLLTSTCGKYAQHAGRTRLSPRDIVNSFAELGLSLDELKQYLKDEGLELGRYAIRSFRRIEDLNEYRAHLQHGLKLDKDDIVHLQHMSYDEEEEEPEDDEEELTSPPPSPPRKRPRTLDWDPPDHIPDFLPPFPTSEPDLPPSPRIQPKVERLATPLPHPAATAAAASTAIAVAASSASAPDINIRVPYSQSSLASVSEWHVPGDPTPESNQLTKDNILPTPLLDPSLTAAYLHILKNPPSPTLPPANPSRHRVAMNLLGLTQTASRWDVADTLYANVAPNIPCVAPIGPTYAVPTGSLSSLLDTKKPTPDLKLPQGIPPRSIGGSGILANNVSAQGSRIPELARCVVPHSIYSRVTRVTHPPILSRGPKRLTYGPGVAAPWNSAAPHDPAPKGINGFGKPEHVGPALPDARLFATWDYESKDCRVPLHLSSKLNMGRSRMGSQVGLRGDGPKETSRPTITLRGVTKV